MASIVGLLTSGAATLYGALVADDQLQQSKEAGEDKKREQAARVAFWVERSGGSEGLFTLHVMNRSPDPVSDVNLAFSTGFLPRKQSFGVALQALPPCSDLQIPEHTLRYVPHDFTLEEDEFSLPLAGPFAMGGDHPVPYSPIDVGGISFVDRNGARWTRTENGLLTGDSVSVAVGERGQMHGQPVAKALKSCSDYSGS